MQAEEVGEQRLRLSLATIFKKFDYNNNGRYDYNELFCCVKGLTEAITGKSVSEQKVETFLSFMEDRTKPSSAEDLNLLVSSFASFIHSLFIQNPGLVPTALL
jgi:hypothetical protein